MSDTLLAAIIAGSVAVTVAFLTQFVAEAYKRHRDGSATAAAIAGELGSYAPAWPLLTEAISVWRQMALEGRKGEIPLRNLEKPTDLVIGEMVSKLGLLGAESVERIAFVYGNIRGFRNGFEVILRDHPEMKTDEFVRRCDACLLALERAHRVGEPLIRQLHARSQKWFMLPMPAAAPDQPVGRVSL